MTGILASGLTENKLSRENALRMIELCKSAALQSATQKEEERLLAATKEGLVHIASLLAKDDPLDLLDSLVRYTSPTGINQSSDAAP